jgi:hypothetical protein
VCYCTALLPAPENNKAAQYWATSLVRDAAQFLGV